MSSHCKQYTVMEVKRLIEASEGKGPGVGGHAIKEHGHARVDVTSRGKPTDGAFERGWTVKTTSSFEDSVMRGVFDDYDETTEPVKRFNKSSDQYLAVCNALNSDWGQVKLKELDAEPDVGTFSRVFDAEVNLGSFIPTVRTANGPVEGKSSFHQVHIELFKIQGALHLHTAFAVLAAPGKNALKQRAKAIKNANL
ncbi:hypothetical protein [Aquincola tertiaricarbonis]|nr:hypothetical protein [Aquincola tertiaricarbonis]